MPPALLDARIAIIGAGMGGATCALALSHAGFTNVHIYEQAPELKEVGAGINVAPNMSRILDRLGVYEGLKRKSVPISWICIRKANTNEEMSRVSTESMRTLYGYPYMTAHRHDLLTAILSGFESSPNVTVHLDHTVTAVDCSNARFKIAKDDNWLEADVILGADGVKSNIRKQMLGNGDEAEDTGTAAYRILLTKEQMSRDPETKALIEGSTTNRWIAPGRFIIAYPIAEHTLFNIVSTHPDVNFANAPSTSWTSDGTKTEMLRLFHDFDPLVRKFLNYVEGEEVCEWKLRVHRPLDKWVEGSVALVGDACHPTLPHLAQGAAQAIEDGAVLATVLSLAPSSSKTDVNRALRVYELVRKERADFLVAQASLVGKELTASGENEAERDERLRKAQSGGSHPDRWADKDMQEYIYKHDCVEYTKEHWNSLWEKAGSSPV